MRIQFILENPEIVSVNEQYLHPVSKSGFSYFTKSSKLVKAQRYFAEELPKYISEEDIKSLQEIVTKDMNKGIFISLEFGMGINNLYLRDVSNYIKAIEDCLSEHLQVDDCYNLKVCAEKMKLPEDIKDPNSQFLRVTISDYTMKDF